MNNDFDLVKKYSEELDLYTEFEDLERLIESHRRLRDQNIEYRENIAQFRKEGYDKGVEMGMEAIKDGEYISFDKLKSMTIFELANFITPQGE